MSPLPCLCIGNESMRWANDSLHLRQLNKPGSLCFSGGLDDPSNDIPRSPFPAIVVVGKVEEEADRDASFLRKLARRRARWNRISRCIPLSFLFRVQTIAICDFTIIARWINAVIRASPQIRVPSQRRKLIQITMVALCCCCCVNDRTS